MIDGADWAASVGMEVCEIAVDSVSESTKQTRSWSRTWYTHNARKQTHLIYNLSLVTLHQWLAAEKMVPETDTIPDNQDQ